MTCLSDNDARAACKEASSAAIFDAQFPPTRPIGCGGLWAGDVIGFYRSLATLQHALELACMQSGQTPMCDRQ